MYKQQYTAAYFALWHVATFSLRYVRARPNEQAISPGK